MFLSLSDNLLLSEFVQIISYFNLQYFYWLPLINTIFVLFSETVSELYFYLITMKYHLWYVIYNTYYTYIYVLYVLYKHIVRFTLLYALLAAIFEIRSHFLPIYSNDKILYLCNTKKLILFAIFLNIANFIKTFKKMCRNYSFIKLKWSTIWRFTLICFWAYISIYSKLADYAHCYGQYLKINFELNEMVDFNLYFKQYGSSIGLSHCDSSAIAILYHLKHCTKFS